MQTPEPRAQYLNVVLRQIERTSIRIPQFQRHFVWGESNVLELLESIKKGYPIGSILTWRVEASDGYFSGFRVGPFPKADDSLGSYEVVLDGAQRLSTLFGCLRDGTAESVYRVYFDVRSEEFLHEYAMRGVKAWHIPMHSLFDSRSFLQAQGEIAALPDGDELLPRALDLYSTFQDYQIPIIALSNAVLEDVVEVFRRVNSSGTPLSSVDFVRALTWRSSFDLEETFKTFADRYQGTAIEGLSDEFLIRCLAIAAGLSLDTREVIHLKNLSNRPGGLNKEIASMERALDRMADFLSTLDIAGIFEVPYEVQRLLLFAMMYFDVEGSPQELESWIWLSTFAEEHQSKPESYVTRLIRELKEGNTGAAMEVRKPLELDLFAKRVRRSGAAVTVGFDLVLRKRNARSLLSGHPLTRGEGLHALLYSRSELEGDGAGRVNNANLLANLVILSPSDAQQWREMRAQLSVEEIFDVCQNATQDAANIWASQGLIGPFVSPLAVLDARSADLLGNLLNRASATSESFASGHRE